MRAINILEQLLAEGQGVDNTVLGMLRNAGIGKPGKEGDESRQNLLWALKNLRISNERNAPTLYDYSENPNQRSTGKNIIPICKYLIDFVAANPDKPIPGVIEHLGDLIKLKHSLVTTQRKSWEALQQNGKTNTIDKLESWLQNERGKAENRIQRKTGAYDFPHLEVYSDANIDVYKADTPDEAIELGADNYTFCISDTSGGNQFYTYRFGTQPGWGAKQKTSCYFVWFKDKQGNKNHDDMVVVHVGENGEYMVTESKNGLYPWLSKSELLEKYPMLRPALKYMVYKKPTQKEEIARYFGERVTATYEPIPDDAYRDQAAYNNQYNNLAKYDPKYLDIIISTGCELNDRAFEYVFKQVDGSDLVNGNHGDSITKKYIEVGMHPLTSKQMDMLRDAGYNKEVDRAQEVYIRRDIASNRNISPKDLDFIVHRTSKEELADPNNIIHKYIVDNVAPYDRMNGSTVEYLIQLGLLDLAYARELFLIKNERHERWDDDVFRVAFEYVDKGDITKQNSAVRRFIRNLQDCKLTDGMRKMLKDNGYEKVVSKFDKDKSNFLWKRWQERNKGNVTVEETSKGYIIKYHYEAGKWRSDLIDIPNTPKKPVIEVWLNSRWDVTMDFDYSDAPYTTKKLPIVKDIDGNVLKDYELKLKNVPPLTEFQVSWDNIQVLRIESSKLKNMQGLPEVPKDRKLMLKCYTASLEGLKGSDFILGIYGLSSLKGIPNKLRGFMLSLSKDTFDSIRDKSMPDEVEVMEITKRWEGDIEMLPKRIGFLKLGNPSNKITAKGVEYLGRLPNIKDIPTKNVKWYAKLTTAENLRATSDKSSDSHYYKSYDVFYGANAAKPLKPTIEDDYFYGDEHEVYVYPFVSSLKGLICQKATKIEKKYKHGNYGGPSDVVSQTKKPITNYILYIYQNVLIKSLEGIPTKKSYTTVYLYNCPLLSDISQLLKCDRLQTVYISKCPKVGKDAIDKLKAKGVQVNKIDRVYINRDNMPELNKWNGKYSTYESLLRLSTILNGLYD